MRRTSLFEQNHAEWMKDPDYADEFRKSRAEISAVDAVMQGIEKERILQGLTKSELAKKAGLPGVSVRRLFTQQNPNPGIATAAALAAPLGLQITLSRKPKARAKAVAARAR